MSELDVRGGVGGDTVAIEDLNRVADTLRGSADDLGDAAVSLRAVDLHALLPTTADSGARAVVNRLIDDAAAGIEHLVSVSTQALTLAWRSRMAAGRYALAAAAADDAIARARVRTRVLIGSVRAGGRLLGWFDDGTMDELRERPVSHESRVAITDLASVLTSQSLINGEPVVRVIEVPRPGGGSAWIVQIPGTITATPVPGPIAHDGTADVTAMLGESAVLARAAVQALRQVQADTGRFGRDDPVLVSGHSLGGIAAMEIAADEELVRVMGITHVATAGAPVGQFDPQPAVRVLSLEHRQDAIVHLDQVANPDRPTWVTVSRSVAEARILGGSVPVHSALTYRETARRAAEAADSGAVPSLTEWAATAAPFFVGASPADSGAVRVRDFDVRRHQQQDGRSREAGPGDSRRG